MEKEIKKRKEMIIMKTANLKEALKPFFDKLEVNNLDFNFDEETSSFVSTDTFGYEDYELEHYMVIKVINNAGTIFVGTSDGIEFFPTDTLGQIGFDGSKWFRV